MKTTKTTELSRLNEYGEDYKSNGTTCEGEGYISMTGGRGCSKHLLLANAADRKQQQHNSSPSPPMGVRGRAVHPPDKQTNNPGSNAELSLYNTDPEQQRNVFWAAAPPSE